MPMAIGVRFTTLRLRLGMLSPFRPAYRRLGSPRWLVPFSGSALDGELLSSPVDRLAVVTCRLWYASLTCRQFPTGRDTSSKADGLPESTERHLAELRELSRRL